MVSLFGSVPITLLRESGGPPVDWTPDVRVAHFHYPGSIYTETQILGQGLLEVEHLVRLGSATDFQALYNLVRIGGLQSLRIPATASAFTSPSTYTDAGGTLYKVWSDVRITAMSDVQYRIGGTVLCRCTFKRSPEA